jgi:hypothetical protein
VTDKVQVTLQDPETDQRALIDNLGRLLADWRRQRKFGRVSITIEAGEAKLIDVSETHLPKRFAP